MSEPGTPSRTVTASNASRLERLLGPGFSVIISLNMWNQSLTYEVSACKEGHYVNWTMIDDDFDYTDDELVEKFINPAKGAYENARHR